MGTIKDIAARANVSVCTVSRYLNQTSNLKKSTEERILAAIEEVGYIPNVVARSLKTKHTSNVAVVIPKINNLFYSEITSGISEVVKRNHYSLFIYEVEDSSRNETEILQAMLENMMAGVIFVALSYDRSFLSHLHILLNNHIPIVFVNRDLPQASYPLVYPDFYQAGRLAAEHLLESGKRRLALVNRAAQSSIMLRQVQGFLDAAREASAEVALERIFQVETDFIPGADFITRLVDSHADGIFAANELVAVGLIKALTQAGKKVPQDMAVLGFGNSLFGEIITPELTCIDLQNHQLGVKSAEVLLQQIDGKDYEAVTILPPKIIKRKSV